MAAKIFLQTTVATEFEKRNRPNYAVAVRAYTNLKNDSELIEKAIRQYHRIKQDK